MERCGATNCAKKSAETPMFLCDARTAHDVRRARRAARALSVKFASVRARPKALRLCNSLASEVCMHTALASLMGAALRASDLARSVYHDYDMCDARHRHARPLWSPSMVPPRYACTPSTLAEWVARAGRFSTAERCGSRVSSYIERIDHFLPRASAYNECRSRPVARGDPPATAVR